MEYKYLSAKNELILKELGLIVVKNKDIKDTYLKLTIEDLMKMLKLDDVQYCNVCGNNFEFQHCKDEETGGTSFMLTGLFMPDYAKSKIWVCSKSFTDAFAKLIIYNIKNIKYNY